MVTKKKLKVTRQLKSQELLTNQEEPKKVIKERKILQSRK